MKIVGDDKPLTKHADVNRLYPLSKHDRTVNGTERDGNLEPFDAERGSFMSESDGEGLAKDKCDAGRGVQ